MGGMFLAKSSMTFGEWFRQHGIPMLAIVLVAVIVTFIARMLVTSFRRKVSGKVESLTLRNTTLRAFDGTLHVVPNGNMMVVSNRSRGWARAIVDVRVPYGEDVDKVRGILAELFDELRDRSPLKDWLRDGPSVLGIESLSDYALVVRVIADTRPSKRQDAERQLRESIQARLAERGIRVPTPPPMPARSGEGTAPGL